MKCRYCSQTATHGVGKDSEPVCEEHYLNRPMITPLSDEAKRKLFLRWLDPSTSNSNNLVNVIKYTAQEAQRDTLEQTYDWGNEYCTKFSCLRRHCDHCWQELKKLPEKE